MKASPKKQISRSDDKLNCQVAVGMAFAAHNADTEAVIKLADENMYLDKTSHR